MINKTEKIKLTNSSGYELAAQIFKAGWHPKSFISLDGADHLLSNIEDSIYTGQMIAAWSRRYITQKISMTHENL